MYKDDYERPNYADRNSEDVYSKPVRAGKRTYFFDVKTTKGNNDYYLTITESKRRQEQDGSFSFDKHKIFQEGLSEVLAYMKENLLPDVPEHTYEPSDRTGAADGSDNSFSDVKFEEL